jgi:hypothetical protein
LTGLRKTEVFEKAFYLRMVLKAYETMFGALVIRVQISVQLSVTKQSDMQAK